MDNEFFLKEIHDLINSSYKEFVKYQGIANELLLVFHNLSESNCISYCLAYGSLIGAIRDKGHIPWDYDVDVLIPIHEKDKLISCLETQLGTDYYYTYINNIDNYPTSCLRICKKGYSFTSVHLDVFFLIGCPNKTVERDKFVKRFNFISYLRGIKYSPDWFPREMGGSTAEKIFRFFDKFRAMLIPKVLLDLEINLMNKYPLGTTDYCFVAGELRYKKIFKYEWFRERIKVPVDGHLFYVPIGYDALLKSIYKNYLSYLPIQVRFDEFYNTLRIIKKRN